MRYRTTVVPVALATGASLLMALFVVTGGVPDAGALQVATATPTLAPSPTPTPLQLPAAPSRLGLNIGVTPLTVVWDDNSDNEDGFRLRKHVGPGGAPQIIETLPANTTTTSVPQAPDDFSFEEACRGVQFTVVAFNSAGESAPSNFFGPFPLVDCFLGPPPTSTAQLPPSGTGGGDGPSGGGGAAFVAAALAAALGLALGGAAVVAWRSRGAKQ